MTSRLLPGLVLTLVTGLYVTPAAAIGPASIGSERELGERRVELTVQTEALAEPTRVQVYLPSGYDDDPARRWPVTYYLHGAQGDEKRFDAWYSDLIADAPSIFVAPAGGSTGFYSDWYQGGAGGPPMYETYFIEQLVPLIDARFRTAGASGQRALIGESMGGYGVMTYAARRPDLFATSVSISGFVDSNFPPAQALLTAFPVAAGAQPDAIYGPRLTEEVRWRGKNPWDLASNLRDVELQVRTAPGIPDPEREPPGEGTATDCVLERGVYETSRSLHDRLAALGIEHEWELYPLGCHTIPLFRRAFTDALPGLLAAIAEPRPVPETFEYRSIEPRFSIWGWQVDADPDRALEFLQLTRVGRDGLTATGSGTTTVTTPAYFKRLRAVDAGPDVLRPGRDGRLRFTVDLGPAHRDQQYTSASRSAGEGTDGYFTSRTVTLRPHARLLLRRVRIRRHGARACVRPVGPAVGRVKVALRGPGGRVLRRTRVRIAGRRHCVRLARSLKPGRRYTVRATARDTFGHRVTSRTARRARRRRAGESLASA